MSRRVVHLMMIGILSLTSCGVRTESQPRDFDPPPGPRPGAATPVTSSPAAGAAAEPLYFVRTDRLVAVIRRIADAPTPQQQLDHLLAGPTEAERRAGLSSTLNGNVTDAEVRLAEGTATIEIGEGSDQSGRIDDVLAFGQIVCTLTARADVGRVTFQRDGQPLGVPRADGSLSIGGLTAADYTALTAPA